jgi:predicted metalloprotease
MVSPATPGQKTACGDMPEMNAIYCGADKTVYFGADLMKMSYEKYGPMAAIVVTAHEYAHARQHAKTGFITPLGYSVANELQADCLAGVYLKKASPMQFTESQIEQASIFVQALGDYHFFSMDWHGTPEMRSSVFKYGYRIGNMNSCIAGDEANWNLILSNGQDAIREILDKSSDITGPVLKDLFDYLK